jgi:hypothetical protein
VTVPGSSTPNVLFHSVNTPTGVIVAGSIAALKVAVTSLTPTRFV